MLVNSTVQTKVATVTVTEWSDMGNGTSGLLRGVFMVAFGATMAILVILGGVWANAVTA